MNYFFLNVQKWTINYYEIHGTSVLCFRSAALRFNLQFLCLVLNCIYVLLEFQFVFCCQENCSFGKSKSMTITNMYLYVKLIGFECMCLHIWLTKGNNFSQFYKYKKVYRKPFSRRVFCWKIYKKNGIPTLVKKVLIFLFWKICVIEHLKWKSAKQIQTNKIFSFWLKRYVMHCIYVYVCVYLILLSFHFTINIHKSKKRVTQSIYVKKHL